MNNRFLGLPYPVTVDAKGYLRTVSDLNTLKSDLLILLLTNLGERIMLPEYGADLRSLLFDPNDDTLADKAQQMIISAIQVWEPRITVDAVEVSTSVDSDMLNSQDDGTAVDGILGIKVVFKDPQNIQEVQELVLQVPLNGA